MKSKAKVVVVGGGAAGLATAASLKKRDRSLEVAVVEPSDKHYYQPGWTMVGAGVFNKEDTISKSLLLNWLSVSEDNIPVNDLGSWIEAKTNETTIRLINRFI